MNDDVTLFKGCVFDYLTIQWPVPLTSKLFLRKIFRKPSTLFRIIAYNPQNGKVKPLTSLYKLLPNDDTEEVVSTDTISV